MNIVVSKSATAAEPSILFSVVGPNIPEALIAILKALYPGHVFTRDKHGYLALFEDADNISKHRPKIEALMKERVKAGLTQEQLAEKAGINRCHYSRIEAGRKPLTRAMAQRLAEALGVSYTKFFY